jgi:hypothetical protein
MELLEDRCLPSAISVIAVNPQPLPPSEHGPPTVVVMSPTLPLPPPS